MRLQIDLKNCSRTSLLSIVSLLFIVSLALAQAPFISRQRFGHSQAFAYQCTGTGPSVCVSLGVDQFVESGQLITELSYSVAIITSDSFQQIFGIGQIPNESFTIDGSSGRARLAVNTAGLPGFQTGQCTPGGCIFDPQLGGSVVVEWEKNGVISQVSQVNAKTTAYGQTQHENFSRHQESADAVGEVLGHSLDTAMHGSPENSQILHDKQLSSTR